MSCSLKDINPYDPIALFLKRSGRILLPCKPLDLPTLTGCLIKLVDWYTFGILLEVPTHVLHKIEAEHSINLHRRKADLYDYWLKNEHQPTWYKVCDVLMKLEKEEDVLKDVLDNVFPLASSRITVFSHPFPPPPPPPELTILHQGNVARSLTEIQKKFARLVSDIQEALENRPFVKIKRFISGFLHTTLKFDKTPHDLDELFDQLKPHYCFMSYELLREVVEEFVKESMDVCITEYTTQLEEWLQSTTVVEFKTAVENQLEQVTQLGDPLCPVVPVVLKLEGPWMEVMVSNLWKLLKYIFHDKSSVLTHIRIERGSVIVRLLAPQSELLPLLSLASNKRLELALLGIVSVQIGTVKMKLLEDAQILQISFGFTMSFHMAVAACSLSLVHFLLELGINPNFQDESGNTPLITASTFGCVDIVFTLLEHNADVTLKTKKKHSALHAAAQCGSHETAKLLLNAGSNPNDQDLYGDTPLMFAISTGHEMIVKLLIKKKADINLTSYDGQSALMFACEKPNSLILVQILLRAGANPNLQRRDGTTALHLACAGGFLEYVQTLLQFKADPNMQENEGLTPLMDATQYNYHEIVKLLVKSGANIDLKDIYGATALMLAIITNNPDLTATLLKAKTDVNIQDVYGVTALSLASFKGNLKIVEQLIAYKADPNLCSNEGISPLHAASNRDIAEVLLKGGASPNVVSGPNAVTPLHEACATGRVDIVQLLLRNNANPNTLNSSGLTPLCVAAVNGHVEIVDILLKAGAQADLQRAYNDWTPLFFAAVGGHFNVVELLLKYGASLKENKHGVTPQAAAFLAGQYVAAKHLFEVAASTGQLSLPSSPPLVPAEPTSVDTDQTSVESQTTSLDEPISQTPLVNEEEHISNCSSTQPSEEGVLSYFNKVHSTISSGVEWIQNSYDSMIKRFENYLETSRRLQKHI